MVVPTVIVNYRILSGFAKGQGEGGVSVGRSFSVLLLVIGAIALFCVAADKKQLSAAVAAVEANLKTAAGKQYDAQFGNELSQNYASAMKRCKESAPSGKPADFDMFLRLHQSGKVDEALIYPETPVAECDRTVLLVGKFSPPPHGDYWVNIHLQFKH
jgi:hypothetical protein